MRLLPFVDVAGGVYRVNRRAVVLAKPGRIELANDGKAPAPMQSRPLSAQCPAVQPSRRCNELSALASKFTESPSTRRARSIAEERLHRPQSHRRRPRVRSS